MQIGLCLPHFGRHIDTGRLLEVARRADTLGFDSLWVTDHVIVPKDVYIAYREEMLDPLAVLPWLAGVTERIALGTSVIILPYRSPLPVAKLLASVDVLSGGRLIFGAGVGWMEGEFAALGVPFNERGSRTDVEAVVRGANGFGRPTGNSEPRRRNGTTRCSESGGGMLVSAISGLGRNFSTGRNPLLKFHRHGRWFRNGL